MTTTAVDTELALAERLAQRLVALRSAALPGDVLERAKMCVLDQIGIQVRGSTLPHVGAAVDVASGLGGAPEAALPMLGLRLPTPYAAFAAATLGHSCEYDDAHFLCGHPGVCVIPTVLAVGEHHRASGSDVLAALVAGYEAMALSVGPIHATTMQTGWHGTKMSGIFGAAAAAAALMGLDAGTTAQAFAIAGSDVSGTTEYDRSGGEVKRLHPGMAARSGIEAARLAEAGLTGPLTIFEGSRGIYRLFGDGSAPRVDEVWGKEFHIRDVMYKIYPAVGSHQAPLEAVRHLMETEPFDADQVERIVVSCAPWAILHGGATDQPIDMISAQFNLGFSLAVRIVEQSNALSLYMDPARWSDPTLLAISERIRVEGMSFSPGESELGANIEIELRDGRTLSRRQYSFRGQAQDPAQPADIEEKFLGLVDGLLPAGRAKEIVQAVWAMDSLSSITELTGLLQP